LYKSNKIFNVFLEDKIKILIFIYILILFKISIIDYSLVMDEIRFIEIAKSTKWFQSPSPEFFGQLFWVIIKFFQFILPNFLVPIFLKFFFSTLLLLSFLSCIYFNSNNENRFYTLALAITCSYFYWSGKVIGPEVISTSFIFFSLAALSLSMRKTSYIFIGISIGIKLTALPAIVYVFLFDMFMKKLNFQKFKATLLIPIGFLIANPTDHFKIFERIFQIRELTQTSYLNYLESLFTYHRFYQWTWDLVPDGNLEVLTFNSIVIIIILVLTYTERYTLGFIYTIFIVFQFYFVLSSNDTPFPWYFLNVVPISLHVFSKLKVMEIHIFNFTFLKKINLALIILFISFILNSPHIINQLHQKQYQKDIISNFAIDLKCLEKDIKKENLQVVYKAGFKKFFDFGLPHVLGKQMYNFQEPGQSINKPYFLVISRRFLYADTPSQNLLKYKNSLNATCNNLLLFKVY